MTTKSERPTREVSTTGRVAVISCIHGNMEAFETTLDDITRQQVDQIICLGDLVGYGPFPNEVIDLVQRRNLRTIRGCWDEGIGLNQGHCGCSFLTDEDEVLGDLAFNWTSDQVTKDNKTFLNELPQSVRMQTPKGVIVFFHGSPRSTSEYLTESTHDLVLLERAAGAGCDMLVCGHTHVPFVRKVEGTLRVSAASGLKDTYYRSIQPALAATIRSIELSPKLIVNAGSVGEPRHGGTESTYTLIDTGTWDIEIRSVSYDVRKTVSAMRKLGMPEPFIERLDRGQELVGKDKEITCAC